MGVSAKKYGNSNFSEFYLVTYLLTHPINQVVMDLRKLLNFAFYKSNYL